VNANVPQFVTTVTVYVRRGSSRSVGAARCCSPFGGGAGTGRQAAAVPALVVPGALVALVVLEALVVVAEPGALLWPAEELPHPARASSVATISGSLRTARKLTTPRRDNQPGPMALSPLLTRYDHLLLDLDGCVWIGDECVPGAPEAVAALRAAGKGLMFVTNDARRAPEDYVRKLWALGLRASLEEVVTVGAAIQFVLAGDEPGASAYVIGSPAIFRHVSEAGLRIVNGTPRATRADVVVVAAHDELRFSELGDATQAVLGGAKMIAAGRDRTFPTAAGPWPGTGPIVAALEYATERTARSVGKPAPEIFRAALDRLGPGRTLVVGDRVDSDLAGAAATGLDAAIVLSGVSTRAEAEAVTEHPPVAIAADLRALLVAS
jgi:HAD superfamily hydrolase (TIGR01450 family)